MRREMAQVRLRLHMKRNVSMLMAVMIVLALCMIGLARPQDDEGPMSALRFVVVRDSDGKPVRNAEVVLHPVKRKGKQAKGEMELKTDAEGRTNIDGIPYGPLRVQVLAPGFQTFGEDYKIDKAEMEITVKLKRPGGQYSIYENHADAKKADDKKPSEQKPQ
jgi:Carboxypeptidase regulatory-like domain